MPNLKPHAGETRLIVAFDIGTTFSGISYCILEQGRVPEVLAVTRFRGQSPVGGDVKIPSLLYYDKSGDIRAVGAEVLTQDITETALKEGWTKAEWWKLHLRPKHLASSISRDDDLPPLPSGKSAVDILTDFIKYLFDCVKDYIQKHHPALTWSSIEHSAKYIFTLPNGWEGVQQQLYRRAIVRADLVPATPEGHSRVHMLTEGEASLHYCVPNLLSAQTDNRIAAQGVVIIDAGGGTIDLSMFSMTFNPLSCEETAPAECRLQGSVFVTRRAGTLLQKKLKGWEHSSPDEVARFTREFDQTTKLVIKSDQEPTYLRVAGRRYTNLEYNISNGKLMLTGEEAAGLFDESFDAITRAFEQQQKSTTVPITTAFFVGGLSTNDWLWSRLQSYFKERNISIYRPDYYINKAVANGAVLAHVDQDNHMVAIRVARATYGVICAIPAKEDNPEHVRRKKKWIKDLIGLYYIPDYFESKLCKGVRVREEMEFRESFTLKEKRIADFRMQTVRLSCYRGNLSDPKWVDEDQLSFYTFCIIHVDLREAAKGLVPTKSGTFGRSYYRLDYEVIILFGLTELRAYLCWKSKEGERRTAAMITFED